MKVFVLICTIDDGICLVHDVLLPRQEGVQYVVSWQRTKGGGSLPAAEHGPVAPDSDVTAGALALLMSRSDVVVTTLEGRGLCRNRNHAVEVALSMVSDVCDDIVVVIADDDERLSESAVEQLRAFYGQHPEVDVALWRMEDVDTGKLLKPYPAQFTDYRVRPRSYYASSVEMTFRGRVVLAGIRFDERFGLGSPRLAAGEEEVWLEEAQRKGLRVWMVPQVLCRTSAKTTGRQRLHPKVLRSKGAVYGYSLSLWGALLRSCREAVSLAWKEQKPVWPIFRNIWYGVKYIRQ